MPGSFSQVTDLAKPGSCVSWRDADHAGSSRRGGGTVQPRDGPSAGRRIVPRSLPTSAITETAGMGGFVLAAAPAIVRLVGGDVDFALATTRSMYETLGEHPFLQVPILEFRGAPVAIDATAVARTGVLPQINTGMAGRVAGTGQVGAGVVTPPAEVFVQALQALAERVLATS